MADPQLTGAFGGLFDQPRVDPPSGNNTNALQYDRQFSLSVIGTDGKGIDLAALRCVFTVKRGDFQNPNTLDVRIYNVNDTTRNSITTRQQVTVQAGYRGNFGQIFQGLIKQVRSGRDEQKDTYLDITAADSDDAYNYSATAFSIAAGADPKSTVRKIIGDMAAYGVGEGYLPNLSQSCSIRGRVHYGMSKDELRILAYQNDCQFTIIDGQATLIPKLSYIPGVVPVLAFDTGLIGVPEQTDYGINMTTLLNPSLKIGQVVKLDNRSAINRYRYGTDILSQHNVDGLEAEIKVATDGLYYVMVAEHHGDTRGLDWYTDINCLATDATVSSGRAIDGAVAPADAALFRDG